MKTFLKNIIPQRNLNILYHLPKAILANIWYGFPTRGLKVIGVTGTDGKTTTTNMIYQILKAAGKKVSMVSTVNAKVAGKSYDIGFHVTSPDPFSVQKFARMAKQAGDEYLVLEVTSHALDQYRFWGIKLEVGVITNITHEHLDYHKTFANYLATKLRIIRNVKYAIINENLKTNVLRSWDKWFKGKILTFGYSKGDFNQNQLKLKLKIPGDYNLENALAALAVAFVLNIDKETAQKTLVHFQGVEGRMEEIKNAKGIKIIVDFAHTPNALEQALKTLRKETHGKLISVFGRAGQRDIKMRPMLGEISVRLADITVITAEDPRGELEIINNQIAEGALSAGAKLNQNLFVIGDRSEAINFALNSLAKKGDTIGIFGKGHEKSMNLDGKKEISWSDKEAVVKALKNGKQV